MLCLAPAASGQEPAAERAEVARAIRAAVEELSQLRQQDHAARTAHQEQVQRIERDLDRLNRDIATLQPQVQRQRDAAAELQQQIVADADAAAHAGKQIAHLANLALPVVQRMQQRIAGGIAYQRDARQAELDAIASALRQDDPPARTAAIERFFRFAAQEVQLSRTTELWNEPVTLDAADEPRRINAYQLRLGLVHQLMLGEDGRTVGQWTAEGWKTEAVPQHRGQIVELFRVLREERPPSITAVPFAPRDAAGEAKR